MKKKISLILCLVLPVLAGSLRAEEADPAWQEPFQTEKAARQLGGKLIRGGGRTGATAWSSPAGARRSSLTRPASGDGW